MTAPDMSRRGLAGFLGFVAAVPAAAAPDSPDTRLETILAALQQAEGQFGRMVDDDPRHAGVVAHMDLLLTRAAMIRPATDRGYAVKARIARIYGDCKAGELVQSMLLADIMIRGRQPVRAPTEDDVLGLYRAATPDVREAIDRFVRRVTNGYPFDESLAQLGREVPT